MRLPHPSVPYRAGKPLLECKVIALISVFDKEDLTKLLPKIIVRLGVSPYVRYNT